jgi:hypothetical protein
MFRVPPPRCLEIVLTAAVLLGGGPASAADGAAPVDLRAALQAALERQQTAGNPEAVPAPADAPGWLAAPPVVAASYLASDQPWGTDETEISLTLPFFSPEQHRINARLLDADPVVSAASARYREWRVAGVLRDLYGRHRIAELEHDLALTESQELEDLRRSAEPLQATGSLTSFDLWLIRQRHRDAQARLAQIRAQREALVEGFREITGYGAFPSQAEVDGTVPAQPAYHDHPEVLWMAAILEQQLAAIRAGSNRRTPWTVGVIGRELAVPQLREWQYGLEVSVPLSFGDTETPATRSSEAVARQQFLVQQDAWRLDLRDRWNRLRSRREALLAERRLLEVDDLEAQVALNLELVRQDTEMPIENRVLRRLELLRAAARPALIDAELGAVEAGLRQLAGKGL